MRNELIANDKKLVRAFVKQCGGWQAAADKLGVLLYSLKNWCQRGISPAGRVLLVKHGRMRGVDDAWLKRTTIQHEPDFNGGTNGRAGKGKSRKAKARTQGQRRSARRRPQQRRGIAGSDRQVVA